MQYGIQDESPATLPTEMAIDPTQLAEEKRMAKFSKSKEFAELKEHLNSRVEFYQKFLPDGRPITELPDEERAKMWVVANAIIGELNLIMMSYENAAEAVNDSNR